MTPKAYPVKIEIYDHDEHGRSTGDVLALVTMQDEVMACVDIKTGVNAAEWSALADVIGKALRAMELQGDKP